MCRRSLHLFGQTALITLWQLAVDPRVANRNSCPGGTLKTHRNMSSYHAALVCLAGSTAVLTGKMGAVISCPVVFVGT